MQCGAWLGNLHYALAAVNDADWDSLPLMETTTYAFSLLAKLNGSFSAEHGIGLSKLDLFARLKEPSQRQTMLAIKRAIDPENLFNPGKLLAQDHQQT